MGIRRISCIVLSLGDKISNCATQAQGFVEDSLGNKVATLIGKWNDSMYYTTNADDSSKNLSLLWRKNKPPANPTRYNLSSFAITLNELSSSLQVKAMRNQLRRSCYSILSLFIKFSVLVV